MRLMVENYWKQYWNKTEMIEEAHSHRQVGRTKFGKEIEEKVWEETVQFLIEKMELEPSHKLLDLCAGNGVLTAEFVGRVKSIVAVDISERLLDTFVVKHPSIKKVNADILQYNYPKHYFDRIIFYFSAQHFSESEITKILSHGWSSLKKGGVLYIGDVPNVNQKWDFYHKDKYRAFLFDTWLNGDHHIGEWFDPDLFKYLAEYLNFREYEIITQPKFMINSSHRFDVLLKK